MGARLVIDRDKDSPLMYELDPERLVTLGRNQNNTIVLQDEHASRWHAEIFFEDAHWHLRDLDTRNGTLVKGERVTRQVILANNQEINIGSIRIHFVADASAGLMDSGRPSPKFDQEKTAEPSLAATVLQPDELTALCGFMSASLEETDPRSLIQRALQTIQKQTEATVVGFLSLDEDNPLPKLVLPEAAQVDIQLSRRLTQRVQSEGRPVWLKPALRKDITSTDSLLLFADALCVPLPAEGTPLGALHVYKTSQFFTERDLRFCEVLAGHLANSLRLLRVRRTLEAENSRLRGYLPVPDQLIGDSPPLRQLRKLIGRAASRSSTILIVGESGVGKELVALALHRQSPRRTGPLVVVNCAAIAPTLLEAELFGYKKHAFTGADRDHLGLFQQADEGTLFMDEIGELSLECQAKLLRVMDGKGFRPVGASAEVNVDVRIVAATNRNLENEVRQGHFREDLYFRLSVIPIPVPALREHAADIPALVQYFLDKLALENHRQVQLTPAALRRLQEYSWPGNVRQLRSVLECATALSETDTIDVADLRLSIEAPPHQPASLNLEELESWALRQALRQTNGNITQAARLLGIVRDTLASKMKRLGIVREESAKDKE